MFFNKNLECEYQNVGGHVSRVSYKKIFLYKKMYNYICTVLGQDSGHNVILGDCINEVTIRQSSFVNLQPLTHLCLLFFAVLFHLGHVRGVDFSSC